MKHFFNNLYNITRIIIIISPFVILGWLVQNDLAMTGHLEFVYDFGEDSPVITNLFPGNRVSEVNFINETSEYWQQVNQEPVYFETRLPQKFDTAEVEFVYKNLNQPLIQIGLNTMGEAEWQYQFKPLENRLLNNLNWFKIEDKRGTIWQKEKKYLSWDQIIERIDTFDNVAAYSFNLDREFTLPKYQATNNITQINKTLRGAHSFYTYIKDEVLDFSFAIQDINRKEGSDPLVINIYNNKGKRIYQKEVVDDGYISKLDPASKVRNIDLKINGLPEGVYKIELNCEDEIFFRTIKTKQQYITFINRVYLVDNPEYNDGFIDLDYRPVTVYSTIPRLGFETSHEAGLQTIGLNNFQSLTISETHKNYYISPTNVPTYIYSPKNDLKIFGRGLLAFSDKMFFNPEIYELRDFYLPEDIEYLISEYKIPQLANKFPRLSLEDANNQEINEWKKNRVKFDLKDAKIITRKLRFAISAPELNSTGDVIPIKSIKVTFDKEPMTVNEMIKKVFKYVGERF